jgi:membrane protein required for beta-lactamase induction
MAETTGPVQSPSENPPKTLMQTQGVSLGCGTLILIALIVILFSGRGDRGVQRDVRALRSEVAELKKSVDAQAAEIKVLQQKIDEALASRR